MARLIDNVLVMFFYIGIFMLPITLYSFYESSYWLSFVKVNAILLIPAVLFFFFKHLHKVFVRIFNKNIEWYLKEPKLSLTTHGDVVSVIAVSWILLSLVFSLLYVDLGYSFVDGLFESMSGITTSGLSVVDVSSLDKAVILFRSFSGWVGGLGIIGFALSVIKGLTGRKLSELFGVKEDNFISVIRRAFFVYVVLTMFSFILLYFVGFEPFFALNLALSGISNNGFFPFFSYHFDFLKRLGLGIVMLLGSISIFIYSDLLRGKIGSLFREDLWFYFFTIGVFSLLLSFVSSLPIEESILYILTTITGGGFSYYDIGGLGNGLIILVSAMLSGAMLGSTGGGIKITRIVIILKSIKIEVEKAFSTVEVVKKVRLGGTPLTSDEIVFSFVVFSLYLFLFFLSSLYFLERGFDILDAFVLSSTSLGNVGISTVDVALLSDGDKVVMILLMYLGRIEIVPFLYLLIFLKRKVFSVT